MSAVEPKKLEQLLVFYDREAVLRGEGMVAGEGRLPNRYYKRIEYARDAAGLVEVRGLLLPDVALEWARAGEIAADPEHRARRWVARMVFPHLTCEGA